MREKYKTVIKRATPFLISNLEVDVLLLSFFDDHNIFVQDIIDEIQVSNNSTGHVPAVSRQWTNMTSQTITRRFNCGKVIMLGWKKNLWRQWQTESAMIIFSRFVHSGPLFTKETPSYGYRNLHYKPDDRLRFIMRLPISITRCLLSD